MNADKNKASYSLILAEYLERTGRRRTPERFAILDCALSLPGHFNSEQILNALEKDGKHVALATVYNTLELLVDCGVVIRHRFNDNCTTFEVAQTGTSHHHLICTRCGRVKESRDQSLLNYMELKRYPSFTPQYFSLTVYGVCSSCMRKMKAKTNKSKK